MDKRLIDVICICGATMKFQDDIIAKWIYPEYGEMFICDECGYSLTPDEAKEQRDERLDEE